MAWLEQPTSPQRGRVWTVFVDRSAPEDEHPYQRRQRRMRVVRRALWASLVVGAIVVLGVVVYTRAATAYREGKQALAAHRYYEAIDHFAAARLLVIPYKNANALTSEAEAALKGLAATAGAQAAAQKLAALTAPIDEALTSGRYHDAAAAMRAAAVQQPGFTYAPSPTIAPLLVRAVQHLNASARGYLAVHTWSAALTASQDALVLQPANKTAQTLRDEARRALRAAPVYAKATAAAAKRQWRVALRLAKRTLVLDPAYPSAKALVTRAQRALAPKPKATATTTPTPARTTPAPTPKRPVVTPPPPP